MRGRGERTGQLRTKGADGLERRLALKQSSAIISNHQQSSAIISYHQLSSAIISYHQAIAPHLRVVAPLDAIAIAPLLALLALLALAALVVVGILLEIEQQHAPPL